jgi:hypothetical protein
MSPIISRDRATLSASQTRQRQNNLCYNPAAMRYEPSGKIFLCVGVRGFDGEGFLESRLLPEDK